MNKSMKLIISLMILSLLSVVVFAQDEKVSVNFKNQDIRSAVETLCKSYNKDVVLDPQVRGFVNVSLTDKPFNTVLSAMLQQANATYEYKDGIYFIKPAPRTGATGIGTGVGNGMGGTMGPATGVGGGGPGIATPAFGGAAGAGAGVNTGFGGAMGNQRTGFGNQQNVVVTDPTKRPIIKIKVNYNSPDQVLAMMDGSSYSDVVYNGSGNSNSNGNNSSDSNNNSNSNSNSNRSNNNRSNN